MEKTIYEPNMRFNNFIIIEKNDIILSKNNNRYTSWKCLCDCGNEFIIRTKEIRKGRKSCGCLNINNRYKKISTIEFIKKLKIGHYKNSAKKRNLEFSLSDDEFLELITGNCYYCGTEPYKEVIRHSHKMFVNGIDRIDSKLGYISSNVVSCCRPCNSAKGDMEKEEFEKWIEKLIKHRYENSIHK